MLSYHKSSHGVVSKVYQVLQDEHILVWFNENSDTNNLYDSLADGVENAAVVCCFMTEDYEKSQHCKLELQYAQKRHKTIIPCLLSDTNTWVPSGWLGQITTGPKEIHFYNTSASDIDATARELIYRIKAQLSTLSLPVGKTTGKPGYLLELIRYEYLRNSRIERLMNPSKSYPIEQSYINLAIVKTKEQHEKEEQLHHAQCEVDIIMGAFEEIYGTKTAIDIKNIFDTCKDDEKQVLVFGRAGIGKSTFCRFIAYQWAIGSYWPQYELLALIPLRHLTASHYPDGKSYSLLDLLKQEIFRCDLAEKGEESLKKQFDPKKTLWILDGYDEIIQNMSRHLQYLLEQLLNTPHHIITSRPYLNTLSYDVQMEITGFTDKNIKEYVQRFFAQLRPELDDASVRSQRLLSFLRSNPSIWGVAHIPVNLELMCSTWSNEDWSKISRLTVTSLYTMMTEWLCRRYLTARNIAIQQLRKKELYQRCQKEVSFLERLAFHAMESNTIIIRPSLLDRVLDETDISLKDHPHILNIGILKSFNTRATGTQIETDKDHYFVHLSFQEYFAARYLINSLKQCSTEEAIQFIKYQKYNRRYALVFSFAAGLISERDGKPFAQILWNNILGEPLDLVGIRHMQLVISCLEETSDTSTLPQRAELLKWIAKCIEHNFFAQNELIREHLSHSLQRAPSVVCDQTTTDVLIHMLQCAHTDIIRRLLPFIREIQMANPSNTLIMSITNTIENKDSEIKTYACRALESMGEKAATNEVINKLVSALGDQNGYVGGEACNALGSMGEKAATNEVINTLASALGDQNGYVRMRACEALGSMGEKAATNEVINKLVSALGDQNGYVRKSACEALGNMGEKAATKEVINKLVRVLEDQHDYVREGACKALGSIGEKATTNEMINKLVVLFNRNGDYIGDGIKRVVQKIFSSSDAIAELDPGVILSLCLRRGASFVLENVSEEQIIKILVTVESSGWLSVLTELTLLRGTAVTFTEDKVVLFGSKEPVAINLPNTQVREHLIKAFTDQAKGLHLYFKISQQ